MKKATHKPEAEKRRKTASPTIQKEGFLRQTRTAVFLYMFQDGEVYIVNSFPHLMAEPFLVEGEGVHDFHIHEFAEILLLAKGYLLHEVNGSHHILGPGSVVFVRPYDLHRLLPVNSERVVFASLAIDSAAIRELLDYLAAPSIATRFNTAPEAPCLQLPYDEARMLMLQMESLSNEQAVNPENSTPMARAFAAQLFANCLGRMEPAPHKGDAPPAWLSKLREAAENWEELNDAVQRFHEMSRCHPSHLCKSFQRYYQETPTDFLNRLRLRKAALLLSEAEAKVLAVSTRLGFDSVSHFHHLFKRYFGVTPAEYRRTLK